MKENALVNHQLGLTETEYRIFQEILKREESPLGKVIKQLGLHKGTAYNSIRRLQEKGYIGCKNVDGVNVYAINLLSLKRLLKQEAVKHEESVKTIQGLIKLAEGEKQKQQETKIQVLIGKEGFKSFLDELYAWAYKKKETYLFIGKEDEIRTYLGNDYYSRMQMKRKKLKLKQKLILTNRSLQRTDGDIRYLKTEEYTPTLIWIYGDTITFVLWDAKPIATVIIHSKEAAKSFRTYFEHLWPLTYGPKMLFESRHKINLYEFINKSTESLAILDIVGFEPLHEGRNKILELLRKKKPVRILLANPKSGPFKKRVFFEERYIKNLKESRMFFEWKSAIANLKDIYARTKKSKFLEVRLYDAESTATKIIIDEKELLDNPYVNKIKGQYGATQPSIILNNGFDKEQFSKLQAEFEALWKTAKPIPLD